jgi:hypothetical protein
MKLTLLSLLLNITYLATAQGFDAEVINYNTHISYNGKNIQQITEYEIQINNAAGTEFAEIEIFYSLKNPIKDLSASILDLFGNKIRTLKKKEITTTTAWSGVEFHSDGRLKMFDLIHTNYPYIIKYRYSQTFNDYISIANWYPHWNPKIKTRKAELVVEIPQDTRIHIFQQKVDSALVSYIDNTELFKWELTNYSSFESEPYSPLKQELAPKVIIMPEEFHYGVDGTAKTWKDFGNWKCELIKGLDTLPPSEQMKVHQITDTIKNPVDKIKALYHYLQDNTRYILVSLDKGGLIPYPASYVCDKKYGDCKALSIYMKALLKEIDIQSYYTTVYAGTKPVTINPGFPSHQTNHIILCVPYEKDTIWLECTSKITPFNYLGSFTQNRLALINRIDNSQLIKTPKQNLSDVLVATKTHITLNGINGTFKTTARAKGQSFENYKYFESQYSEKEKQEFLEENDLTDYKITQLHRDSAFLTLTLNGKVHALCQSLGSKTLLNPYKPNYTKLTKPEERKSDIFVSYPINQCDTVIYEFDKEISDTKGLSMIELKSEFGSYTTNFEIKGKLLYTYRTFQLKQGRFPRESYPEFYQFYKDIESYDMQKAIISY